MDDWILVVHAASTLSLTGLIWMVQVVHYPLLQDVGRDSFQRYHQRHTGRITLVVGPLMLAELATAGWIAIAGPDSLSATARWTAFALVTLIWLSTAMLQVPQHNRLGRGPDRAIIARLVAGNWIRTVAWTVRAGLALFFLMER